MDVMVPSSFYVHALPDRLHPGFPSRASPVFSDFCAAPMMASMGYTAHPRGGDDDADDFEALLREIDVLDLPPTGLTPVPMAGAGVPAHAAALKVKACKKLPKLCYTYEYDAEIDATLRAMETDPKERPLPHYLQTTQAGRMCEVTRAYLVAWMHELCMSYDLAPGALHLAVSFADRFLSLHGHHELRLLGAAAVFTAAKYEERHTIFKINADDLALHGGFTRHQVLDMELDMVFALDFLLSGPTAYTFVYRFTMHSCREEEEEGVVELAHHLADLALLHYRCVGHLPSVVAASAIFLARLAFNPLMPPWSKELRELTGYNPMDLADCMDAIYDMHEIGHDWPGCFEMKQNCMLYYSLPPRSEIPTLYLQDQ